jgi:TPR repeat protein
MATLPEPVKRFSDALESLAGVREVSVGLRGLDGMDLRELSLPGEFGDLPHAAQAELGECYELGKGVKANTAEALRWYEAALENGLDAVQPAIERVKKAKR